MNFIVFDDQNLLDALARFFPNNSKSSLRNWIKGERVSLDGETVKIPSQRVLKGQNLRVGAKQRMVADRIPIVYEDPHFIVIDKPAGLLSVSTAFEKTDTVFGHLKRKFFPKPVYVVHRLDQETSGVILFALSETACTKLKAIFERHDLTRRYVAIVEGQMACSQGSWESYLVENQQYVVRSTGDSQRGELAITHFQVEATTRQYSWLALTLETGKKNQIRVHCSEAGHPVSGDKKYGGGPSPNQRLCLHAQLLAFTHPITGKAMRFTSPVPSSFYQIIEPAGGRGDA